MARELGMTRAELTARMSGSEFAYWIALMNIEARERDKAQRGAQNKARAQQLAARMRGS